MLRMPRLVIITITLLLTLIGCGAPREVSQAPKKPNFIIFLVDDLGWSDGRVFGSDLYETPNIDRLAADGMRFTTGYAACTVCSPTRAAMMTGKYPGPDTCHRLDSRTPASLRQAQCSRLDDEDRSKPHHDRRSTGRGGVPHGFGRQVAPDAERRFRYERLRPREARF